MASVRCVGNRLDFHNQSSVWPSSIDDRCIIGSRDAILKISAHGRWDEGMISTITPIKDVDPSIIAMIYNNIYSVRYMVFS